MIQGSCEYQNKFFLQLLLQLQMQVFISFPYHINQIEIVF